MSAMSSRGLANLAVAQWITMISGVIISYSIAVYRKDVPIWLPFISDAGGYNPQCSIFGSSLSVAGFLSIVISYALWHSIDNRFTNRRIRRTCKVFAWFGVINGVGKVIVAASPIRMSEIDLHQFFTQLGFHITGALMIAVGSLGFMSFGTILTHYTKPRFGSSSKLLYTRLLLTIVNYVSLVVLFASLLSLDFDKRCLLCLHTKPLNAVQWESNLKEDFCQMYFRLTTRAAIGEWISYASIATFFLTLKHELRQVNIFFNHSLSSDQALHEKNIKNLEKSESYYFNGNNKQE